MKKLLFMLLGIAATMNVMAVNYSATATLNLSATSGYGSVMYLQQSNAFGELDGAEMYMDVVGLYAIKGTTPLQIAQAADFTNVALGLKTDASTSYTITVSGATGDLVLYDLADMTNIKSYPLVNGQINFTAPANSTIEDRFVINYQAPAPTCTTVRNNLVANRYYTICLDQAVESANGASFWNLQYRNAAGTLAYLVEAEFPLVAGRPYIFQAEDDELCVELSGTPVNGPGYYGALKGTFADMDQAKLSEASELLADSKIYLLFNNELWRVDYQNNNSLAANRAYVVYDWFEESEPNAAPGRRVRAIPMQANGTTGIENIKASEAPAKMIIDGKMYILRGEQMFDATGRLVK